MSKIYSEIKKCRICGSKGLTNILDLGNQALTGVFPKPEEVLRSSPVKVCKCDHCNLVQLRHTVELGLMYGETYGYESSLNGSMVRHLEALSNVVKSFNILEESDIILDIGSNDATFLKNFDREKYKLIGIDPTASKFLDQYVGMRVETDFFSKNNYTKHFPDKKAKVVTSIACFYDLENPIQFARETADVLHKDGVWLMEMAYLPAIIENLCFDGYVQEHLEYYSLRDIKYIMDQSGLKIISVDFTDTNGGSFLVCVAHEDNQNFEEYWRLESLLISESHLSFLEIHKAFEKDVLKFKNKFRSMLEEFKSEGKVVYGLGASTKFNVVLQYCNIGPDLITAIGEVNSYKFGRVTPGTGIPIIPEDEVLSKNPDYLVVGPYHFRDSFVKTLEPFLEQGGKVIFPLPNLEVYSK